MSLTSKRRQNHACIQCKASKKRCDGYLLNVGQRNSVNCKRSLADSDSSHSSTFKQQVSPCSYCTRTRKQCSLNQTWAPSGSEDEETPSTSSASVECSISTMDTKITTREGHTMSNSGIPGLDRADANPDNTLSPFRPASVLSHRGRGPGTESEGSFSPTSTGTALTSIINRDTYGRRPGIQKIVRSKRKHPSDGRCDLATILSPFSPEYSLSSTSNNHIISQSLLQIYHDVVENNLMCWVTDKTCPYKMLGTNDQIEMIRTYGRDDIPPEWGAGWPNRMYQRVIQLDRVSQTEVIRLTPDENRSASRALDLAIMAFAAQWAQGNRRQSQFPSATWRSPSQSESLADGLAEDFEQDLQASLWEQASTALQGVCELECFRVVYAEFIFGLTQKPWVSHDRVAEHRLSDSRFHGATMGSLKASLVSEITEMFFREDPPVYLERAVRKVQALKYRFQARQAGLSASVSSYGHNQTSFSKQIFSKQDKLTLSFLYWLLVMHDTVCMPMSERPVVLADEHCQTDALKEQRLAEGPLEITNVSHRWRLNHFLQDDPDAPQVLRWPCLYPTAAGALVKSTPVKILLFRYVFYLQTALRNQEDSRVIESFLQGAISVCRYWKMTYGAFFLDLIQHYDSVPQRLRTWFVCIHVAWNLGTFMLADLIDCIDGKELSKKIVRSERRNNNIAAEIRKHSVFELSELAKVTVPLGCIGLDDASEHQLPTYHFALRQSPLLTEPCTAILIKAFTKASIYYLSMAFESRSQKWSTLDNASKKDDFQENSERALDCLRALWCLGRKSELASNVVQTAIQYFNILRDS